MGDCLDCPDGGKLSKVTVDSAILVQEILGHLSKLAKFEPGAGAERQRNTEREEETEI